MPNAEKVSQPAILSSWKEIAAYLGKGVRTVQRWEKDDRLPVRRIAGTSKIVAYREELDCWLHSQPAQNGGSFSVAGSTNLDEILHSVEAGTISFRAPVEECSGFTVVLEREADRVVRDVVGKQLVAPLTDDERRSKDQLIEQLKQELATTKKYLQSIIESQEALTKSGGQQPVGSNRATKNFRVRTKNCKLR